MVDNTQLLRRVAASFQAHFNCLPALVAQAPARVNLIGEHTDYNDGFVFPCAIDYQTIVCLRPRADNITRVVAADLNDDTDEFQISADIAHHGAKQWANYVRGVVQYLYAGYKGARFPGVDMCIGGNVPQGAGLSSSASLEVAIATALTAAFHLPFSPTKLALLSQQAENLFVGCNSGIMDQLISAVGEEGSALLIDCRSLATRAVPIPDDLEVLIVNSNVKRGLVDSAYNDRRRQCEEAARFFGVPALRDVTLPMLESAEGKLDALLYRRARHIVTENRRTLDMAEALKARDLARIGELMAQSHRSMQFDFEITHPAVDYLVEIIAGVLDGKGGARMTGGGFGGCVVTLAPTVGVGKARRVVEEKYAAKTGLSPSIYQCRPQQGAGIILR
ncbi:MAG: galactokinase [Methylobacteriaceae bacterium]|jgi:galactokinase|nr:galactokinase [Methylobacteriaceae bacterium]